MPCPYFEPQRVATHREHSNARLPLLDEYEGLCHAGENPIAAPSEHRFRFCNHGYCRGCCNRFPAQEDRSSLRYTVIRRTATALDLICVEEQGYSPLRWRSVEYLLESERLAPEITDVCARAQVLAFCRSYIARFVDPTQHLSFHVAP